MRKFMTFTVLGLACLLVPAIAQAQDVYGVAIFAPCLDFKDGAARNDYISKVADYFSKSTGLKWEGQAFARASDFEAARSKLDVVIVDAEYYANKLSSLTPIGELSGTSGPTRSMKVIAKRGGSDKLYNYKGKRLAIVSNTPLAKNFFESNVLGSEATLSSYFASVDEVRDVRAALNAVELGKADLTLAFDGYDRGYTTIYTTSPVPLPVIAVSSSRLSGSQLESVKLAARSINVSATSIVNASTSYSQSGVSSFKAAASGGSHHLPYVLVEPGSVQMRFSQTQLLERYEGFTIDSAATQYSPSLADFDQKLEQAL